MNKEKEILDKIKDFLGAKEVFLNVRQITIEKLQDCCNKLETSINIGKYAKINEKGNIISAGGTAFNSLTLGIVKAFGELISARNSYLKRKFSKKSIEIFQTHLAEDEKNLKIFNKACEGLVNVINQNKKSEINSSTINNLKLESGEQPRLFDIDYKIFEVVKHIWKGKVHLTPEEMKRTIELLSENLKELKSELEQEQKWFAELWKQLNDPIEINNNTSEKNNFISIGNVSWEWTLGIIIVIALAIWLFSRAISWAKNLKI